MFVHYYLNKFNNLIVQCLDYINQTYNNYYYLPFFLINKHKIYVYGGVIYIVTVMPHGLMPRLILDWDQRQGLAVYLVCFFAIFTHQIYSPLLVSNQISLLCAPSASVTYINYPLLIIISFYYWNKIHYNLFEWFYNRFFVFKAS